MDRSCRGGSHFRVWGGGRNDYRDAQAMTPLAVDCPTCGRHAGETCIWIPVKLERKEFHTARVGLSEQHRAPTGSFDEGDPHEIEIPNL